MTLPASGAISFNDINVELGVSGTTTISMNDTAVRTLFGIASGAIDMNTGHGKSNRVSLSYTFSSTTTNASLNVTTIGGYSAGKSDITITVNSGVYLYATSTGSPGLTLSGGTSGDTITLVNNGFIIGKGGTGASGRGSPPFYNNNAVAGGPALQLGYNTTVNNTNGSAYIAGGGGGGAGSSKGGGGGAGGGDGGDYYNSGGYQGFGGGTGSAGSNSVVYTTSKGSGGAGGGGGGRILPGSGGQGGGGNIGHLNGYGGGAGGGGSGDPFNNPTTNRGGDGGSGSNTGGNGTNGSSGGGGGWGASGGSGGNGGSPAGGGKAVNLNGYSITWVSGDTSRVYGSVS